MEVVLYTRFLREIYLVVRWMIYPNATLAAVMPGFGYSFQSQRMVSRFLVSLIMCCSCPAGEKGNLDLFLIRADVQKSDKESIVSSNRLLISPFE